MQESHDNMLRAVLTVTVSYGGLSHVEPRESEVVRILGELSTVLTGIRFCSQFTWPEFSVSDEVHVDDFWLTMESEAIEQATFPTDIPITRVDASIIAPFIPSLMRSPTVINTEKEKVLSHTPQPSGT